MSLATVQTRAALCLARSVVHSFLIRLAPLKKTAGCAGIHACGTSMEWRAAGLVSTGV